MEIVSINMKKTNKNIIQLKKLIFFILGDFAAVKSSKP
jgi:hypothetical protein